MAPELFEPEGPQRLTTGMGPQYTEAVDTYAFACVILAPSQQHAGLPPPPATAIPTACVALEHSTDIQRPWLRRSACLRPETWSLGGRWRCVSLCVWGGGARVCVFACFLTVRVIISELLTGELPWKHLLLDKLRQKVCVRSKGPVFKCHLDLPIQIYMPPMLALAALGL